MKKHVFMFAILLVCILACHTPAIAAEKAYTYTTVYPENYKPPENAKIVYLTFDDGPTKYTPEILDILEKYNIPATFFVVGNREHNHLMSDIVEKGHAIGLHSYDHNFDRIYSSKEAFLEDLKKIDDIVYAQTGVRSNITRFPGGSSVKKGGAKAVMPQLKEEIAKMGYQFFDWNCDSRDKMGVKTASVALSKIKTASEDAGDIIIVLMHDTEKITVQYLPGVIEHFLGLGYDFLPLCKDSPAIHHGW
ncbi:MAG: polysaccharide deacetylase [Defluviitaleaceae bacterium]|nr:polysaccharide deacetylase [Defluviitaleaceae bacterium]